MSWIFRIDEAISNRGPGRLRGHVPMKMAVTAVAFQDQGRWIAQCLEHDIAVSAGSVSQLLRMFEKAIASNVCVNQELGRRGLEGIPPAPQPFWDMFSEAESHIEAVEKSESALPVYVSAMRLAEVGTRM